QKLVAQQDGLRRVVDAFRLELGRVERNICEIDERVEILSAKIDQAAGRDQVEALAGTISLQRDDSARIEGLVTSLKDELEQGLLRIATADSLCQPESSISGLRNSVDVLGASVEERVQNTHSRLELLTENSHVLSDQVLEVGERLAEFEATREHLLTRSLVEVSERIDGLRLR